MLYVNFAAPTCDAVAMRGCCVGSGYEYSSYHTSPCKLTHGITSGAGGALARKQAAAMLANA